MTESLSGPIPAVRARLSVPGDKSISHRALVLSALAEGEADVCGLAPGADVLKTVEALAALGVRIERGRADRVRVGGVGAEGASWRARGPIDCGNSGTTARLLLGVLAARARGGVTLTGDPSLSRRPMRRVVDPLARMGASIRSAASATEDGAAVETTAPVDPIDRLPLVVEGRSLHGAAHRLSVASAQVKTALLLAGLAAEGETSIEEPHQSRDHTERMLAWMGAPIDITMRRVAVRSCRPQSRDIEVPGDLSSAAPFLALAAAVGGGEVVVEEIGLNPTRTGLLDLLEDFGVEVEVELGGESPEPRGRIRVRGRGLGAIVVSPDAVPRAIDEIPLVAVLATQAEGVTTVRGAGELRVKESDRIEAIAAGLRRMGAAIETTPDGLEVTGPTPLRGAALDAAGDHRIGMALAVAALIARGKSALTGAEWVGVSYPTFFEDLAALATGAERAPTAKESRAGSVGA